MSYFITTDSQVDQGQQMIDRHEAELLDGWIPLATVPVGKTLLCDLDDPSGRIGNNVLVIIDTDEELNHYNYDDGAPRKWLLIDTSKAQELCPAFVVA